ncbi:MAG: DUF938 domain-containing protein [Acetobacteraceae bacterium]|nr:DUF938 domain-containing protein [Acetobacteraceae bacterium]
MTATSPGEAARHAPAVARNRDPILAVLRERLPQPGMILEIASGTGEHAAWFSRALPSVTWQPTDPHPEARSSIAAWRASAGLVNLLPPLPLDATAPDAWPAIQADAIVAINMIHIAPWAATEGLFAGAARVLPPGGLVYLYGPFREDGAHTAPSNAAFDATLQATDPAWGVRDLAEVAALAADLGVPMMEKIAMPANNLSVVFRRA